jgi:hypothetical protein
MTLGAGAPGQDPRNFQRQMAETIIRNRETQRQRLGRYGREMGATNRRVMTWALVLVALGLMLYGISGYGTASIVFGAAILIGALGTWRLMR